MHTCTYSPLSQDSAPGIILAHGSIGSTLSVNPDLYVSRDGGVTWEQTLVGSWGVTVADHGGLMVAAKDYHQDYSTELMYSCSEGDIWTGFSFTTTPMKVFGVLTEPGEYTTTVRYVYLHTLVSLLSPPSRMGVFSTPQSVFKDYSTQSCQGVGVGVAVGETNSPQK